MTINNKTTKVKEITEASASVRLLLATAVSVVKWPVKRFSDQKCSDKNVILTEKKYLYFSCEYLLIYHLNKQANL